MNKDSIFRQYIETGAFHALSTFLQENPEYSNKKIRWGEKQKNVTDPLHYVSDCVFNGSLINGNEGVIAQVLIDHGAVVDGTDGAESPLIGATSLSAQEVAKVLLQAGARIELTSVFGAGALHWAAFVGTPIIVEALLEKGAHYEVKCTEFCATPLFWAVQGYSKYGPPVKTDQVGAARVLIEAGADVGTKNIEGVSALARSKESDTDAMTRVLSDGGAV